MKSFFIAAALFGAAAPALAQTNVSINIGQPGFYGRIDLGDFRQPPVVYARPMIIERHVRAAPEPIYLRVPPGHMKKWSKHCRSYDACGRQVYFVRDDWYNNTYAPRYRQVRDGGREQHQDRGQRMERHDDNGHGNGNGDGNGHGNDRGHGKDKGHKDKGQGKDKGHGKHKD